jgi:glycerophosphoryl diester phosphodiesterase
MPGVAGAPAPQVWAHRGARRQAPENTVEAFVLALALGADGVELDARRSGDGVVVVHHDAAAPGLGVLASVPFAAIRAARPEIPTLDEALDACRGALVNVEVKNLPGEADYDPDERVTALVAELLARRDDEVVVSSFSLPCLDRFRALDATRRTGLLTLRGFDPADALALAADRGHDALHPDRRGLARRAGPLTARAHELGLTVHVWTVNDPAAIRRFADAGADAVITDVPDVAVRTLRR